MAIPESNREVYTRNPLAEVTAHLRFPAILRIEAEIPARFQDAIRDRYPVYRRGTATGELPPDVPPHIRNVIQGMGAAGGPVQHFFGTQEQMAGVPVSHVALSRETLMLKTTAYTHWEEFREQLERLRAAFEQIYNPSSYTRVGLRYVDIIRRSKLELDGVAWQELLNPSIGAELCAPEFGENIDSAQGELHCKLDGDNCFLTMRTGIALPAQTTPGAVKERCFLINCDFHTHERTEIDNVTGTLDIFNRASGNLFRWAIRPRLRDALQPRSLG